MTCSMCTGGGIVFRGLSRRRIDHLHDGFIGEPEPSVGRARDARVKRERRPDTVQGVEHVHLDDRVRITLFPTPNSPSAVDNMRVSFTAQTVVLAAVPTCALPRAGGDTKGRASDIAIDVAGGVDRPNKRALPPPRLARGTHRHRVLGTSTRLTVRKARSSCQILLAFNGLPPGPWRKLWTTNPLERVNGEIKRRTNVVGIFPNDA